MPPTLSTMGLLAPTLLAAALYSTGHAQPPAQSPEVELHIVPPTDLRAGDRREIRVEARLRSDRPTPFLLTPSAEGTALSVVRGRMGRSDAETRDDVPGEQRLVFRVPVVAHTAGTAILSVRALTYVCGDEDEGGHGASLCRAVTADDRVTVTVARARSLPTER